MMFEIKLYTATFKNEWDEFIKTSRNGTFLFQRDYMDYHSDRFSDCSFLFLHKGKLHAVFPANVSDNILYSHQGLTYGGLVVANNTNTTDVLLIFQELNEFLKGMSIQKVIYKPVPYIYHKIPSQEDLYALYRLNAKKIGCAISSVIFQNNKIRFSELRKRGIKKAQKENLTVCSSIDFEQFIQLLNINLQKKYGTSAVHSHDEIKYLYSLFPENIKLYVVEKSGVMIAGVVVFITPNVIHVQYIVASDVGKQTGSLDLLFHELINNIFTHVPVFDFGISTEDHGKYLNENLIFQKEGFGGRGVVYEIYEYPV
jgi:hypothetical protein